MTLISKGTNPSLNNSTNFLEKTLCTNAASRNPVLYLGPGAYSGIFQMGCEIFLQPLKSVHTPFVPQTASLSHLFKIK